MNNDDTDSDYTLVSSSSTSNSSFLKKLLLLGTGTSGQVPAIHCLATQKEIKCDACRDALKEGSKNRRGCTSVALIGGGGGGKDQSLILIDVGPTFYQSALKYFRPLGLRKISAVLLTHAHSDAILGLDNLRAWTLGDVIQEQVDVYLTQECYDTVSYMFPYLVDSSKATGGGGVGAIRWNIIEDNEPFHVKVEPFETFEGKIETKVKIIPLPTWHGYSNGQPFQCLGFRVDQLSYVSDCHEIPKSTTDLMMGSQAVVIDALKYDQHPSHFSVSQALSLGISLSNPCPPLLLLTDLTHRLEHNKLEAQLQTFVKDLRNWVSNVKDKRDKESITNFISSCNSSSSNTITPAGNSGSKSKVNGEGNQPRWWSSIWSEDDSERNFNLDLKRKPNAGGISSNSESNEGENQKGNEMVPDCHVAFDGMVIHFP